MKIDLDRDDVLQLIDAGEVSKGDETITLRDSRQEAAAARLTPPAVRVDMPFRPRVRLWKPARELAMRKDNSLKG